MQERILFCPICYKETTHFINGDFFINTNLELCQCSVCGFKSGLGWQGVKIDKKTVIYL